MSKFMFSRENVHERWLMATGRQIQSRIAWQGPTGNVGDVVPGDFEGASEVLLLCCSRAFALLVQQALGLVVGVQILRNRYAISDWLACFGSWVFRDWMEEQITWLAGAPGGIKLHRQLSNAYKSIALDTLTTAIPAYTILGHYMPHILSLISVASIALGLNFGLCLASDLLYIAAIPISLMYCAISLVHNVQRRCLGLTWQLLRGQHAITKRKLKQRRQQRAERSETVAGSCLAQDGHVTLGMDKEQKDEEILVEHLIVGVLLFTPLLGLLPTTLVFYTFFAALHCGVVAARGSLWLLCAALDVNPAFCLFLRLIRPALFP
eukprot:evm.model.scf_2098.1 EVM.evm.TU.scf_2098.1   scf_2098:13444-16514(+)